MFIALTRVGGQHILVNTDHITAVRDRSASMPVLILMSTGRDIEVEEGFEDITARLAKS